MTAEAAKAMADRMNAQAPAGVRYVPMAPAAEFDPKTGQRRTCYVKRTRA